MSYRVDSLSLGKSSWSARVSFRNLSQRTITVGDGFGLGFWSTRTETDLADAVAFATATTFSSKPPTKLKPGASWTGTIGGKGQLTTRNRIYARVVFGPFRDFPGQPSQVVWITDHTKAFGSVGADTDGPGPVI